MKKTFTLIAIATCLALSMSSQVIFTENFTATWTPVTQGWAVINNSQPAGTTTVFQGNGAGVFPAYNGGPDDYVGMNFNSTTGAGGISTWLITPSLTLQNGQVLEFATRTTTSSTVYPDRLQILLSPVDNIAIPSGTTSVGTYTTLLLDINPNLTTNTSSVVTGNTVNGYPNAWALYTVAVSGMPVAGPGRIAFRYFVSNGGPSGANSDYIGIDAVKVSNPCVQPTISVAQSAAGVCAGNAVTLTATSSGTNGATTFTWSSGQTGSVAVVSPTATTNYIVNGTNGGGCVGSQSVAVTVTATPNVQVSSYTVCANPPTTATLTASGATTYSWNTGATTAGIAVTPTSTTVYTVTGYAAGGACPNVKTATVTVGSQLSMILTSSSNTVCSGATVTLTAISAASSYSWNTGASTAVITVTPGTTTTYSCAGISGSFPNVCAGGNTITVTVAPSPTLTSAVSPTAVCQGQNFTLTATGANTYTWLNTPTSGFTGNPVSLIAGAAGPRQYTLVGVGANGCASGLLVNFTVNPTPTVTAVANPPVACFNTTILLTGSGAASYVWSGGLTSSSNPATFSTGTTAGLKTFTLTGTSAEGCTGTVAISASVSACAGIESLSKNNAESSVFPNPFSNEIKVGGFNGKVEVYNAVGQMVINQIVSGDETIITSELSKGAYIVKLISAEGAIEKTVKLIKN
jgi:hypothetical protein